MLEVEKWKSEERKINKKMENGEKIKRNGNKQEKRNGNVEKWKNWKMNVGSGEMGVENKCWGKNAQREMNIMGMEKNGGNVMLEWKRKILIPQTTAKKEEKEKRMTMNLAAGEDKMLNARLTIKGFGRVSDQSSTN